ncbi:hypothetical protein BH11PSE3_BH11PSE3_30310 [soil metagenome]
MGRVAGRTGGADQIIYPSIDNLHMGAAAADYKPSRTCATNQTTLPERHELTTVPFVKAALA